MFFFCLGADVPNSGCWSCVDGGAVLGIQGQFSRDMERSLWVFWGILSQSHSFCRHYICGGGLLCTHFSHFLLQALQQVWCSSPCGQSHQGHSDRHLPRLITTATLSFITINFCFSFFFSWMNASNKIKIKCYNLSSKQLSVLNGHTLSKKSAYMLQSRSVFVFSIKQSERALNLAGNVLLYTREG